MRCSRFCKWSIKRIILITLMLCLPQQLGLWHFFTTSGKCEYLLTFDRKHLINPPEVSEMSGLKILTPGDLLQILRAEK